MAKWTRIARLDECPAGAGIERVADDRMIALFNVGGTVYALDGVCPHQGGPLGQGTLCEAIVTCPWHGWQFDVRGGENQLNPRIVQPRYGVRVEDDWILVDLE
jgi:nitrite reductase (NADH) small subunit